MNPRVETHIIQKIAVKTYKAYLLPKLLPESALDLSLLSHHPGLDLEDTGSMLRKD